MPPLRFLSAAVWALGGWLAAAPALAQVPPVLTLEQAVGEALAKNERLVNQSDSIAQADLARASEVMFLGTTTLVASITHIDGHPVGDGTPGPEARRLLKLLIDAYTAGRDIE